MINVNKQITYWETGAVSELLNAKIMIENQRFLTCLFFCHLCLEKILKAHVVKITQAHPSRTHILRSLAATAQIEFDNTATQFISEIQIFQLEGRYPDSLPSEPDAPTTQEYYNQTIILHKWLKEKL